MRRRLPGWAIAVAAALAVLIGLGGLSLVLSGGSGPSAATTESTETPTTAVPFDATAARSQASRWWNEVINGNLEAARSIAHPEADFNYSGIEQAIHAEGAPLSALVDQSSLFGTATQPHMCFEVKGPDGSFVGGVVFRPYQDEWRVWEIRPHETACDSQPSEPATGRLGFDHIWGLAYPPGWYRAGSELMPTLGFRSITVATMPIRPGGKGAHMPDNALRDISPEDVLLTVFFQGALSRDSQPIPETLDETGFPAESAPTPNPVQVEPTSRSAGAISPSETRVSTSCWCSARPWTRRYGRRHGMCWPRCKTWGMSTAGTRASA